MVTEFEGVSKLRTSLLKDLLFQGSQDIRQQRTAIPERWGKMRRAFCLGVYWRTGMCCGGEQRNPVRAQQSP